MASCRPFLACLLLLGCGDGAAQEGAQRIQDSLVATRASLAVLGGAPVPRAHDPVPEPPSMAAGPAMTVALPPPGAPRRRGTAAPPSTAGLRGATAETVRAMLGEPELRRPEGPAEIWLYRADDCRLDVILYRDGGQLQVAHASARAAGATPVTEAACLAGIAAYPRSGP